MEEEIFMKELKLKYFVSHLIVNIVIFLMEIAIIIVQGIRFPATIEEGNYTLSLSVMIIAAFCAGLYFVMIEYSTLQIIKLKKEMKELKEDIW